MVKEEVIHHQDHFPLEELLGTLSTQLLEYCESDTIHDTLQGSEVEAKDGSTEVVLPAGYEVGAMKATISEIGDDDDGMGSLSTIFDARDEDDISASIDFSTSPFVYAPLAPATEFLSNQSERSLIVSQLPSVVDVCLSSIPSCNFLTANDMGMSYVHPSMNGESFCADASGVVIGNMLGINGEMPTQELDYCRGDVSGIFYHNSQSGMLNPGDIQAIGLESQKLLCGHPNSTSSLATEISNTDEGSPTFKVGKLSPEKRKEKIDRYIRKRNERNFSKKIKYACRKTLADSRPRVRGRFAKNDDLGDSSRHAYGNNRGDCHHEDDYDDEENTTSSAEILGHMSGLSSSYNCSFPYPIMDLNSFSDTQLGTF